MCDKFYRNPIAQVSHVNRTPIAPCIAKHRYKIKINIYILYTLITKYILITKY